MGKQFSLFSTFDIQVKDLLHVMSPVKNVTADWLAVDYWNTRVLTDNLSETTI